MSEAILDPGAVQQGFFGVHALSDVSLAIGRGRVWA